VTGDVAGLAPIREDESQNARTPGYWAALCGILIFVIVLCLAMDAGFDRRFSTNITDGVAYLDISDAFMHGNTAALLNAYWSPAYPVALAAGRALLRPSPALELAAIYAIHAAIDLFALSCLIYFVLGLPFARDPGVFGLTRPMLLSVACALFLISMRIDDPIQLMTPDFLLGAFLWLAGGAFLRIARDQRLWNYAMLAVAISLAYFTKAVALSLAMSELLILPFAGRDRKKAIRGLIVYGTVAAALICPYVVSLSRAKGRFTFGESGGLNYAWIVDRADGVNRWHMQGDTPHGHARMKLAHPARRLLKSPDVYEFGSPVKGSFPIFDDPSYWDDGLRPAFYLKGQLWHIVMNLYHTAAWLAGRGEFIVGLALIMFLQRRSRTPARIRETLPVLLWFAGLWGLYVLVDIEARYVFAFLLAMLLLAASSVRLPDSAQVRRIAAVCTLVLVGGVAVRSLNAGAAKVYSGIRMTSVGRFKQKSFGPFYNPYWEDAQTLASRLGLRPGDSVACMQLGCDDTYWARLAGLRITAELSGETDYWKTSAAERAKAMSVLASAGVKAVVTRHLGSGAGSEGWVPLSNPHELPEAQGLYARLTH
jgi:hypothetical protein